MCADAGHNIIFIYWEPGSTMYRLFILKCMSVSEEMEMAEGSVSVVVTNYLEVGIY